MVSTSSTSSGAGFLSILTVLFIGLKLTGNIAWSWPWVLSPLLFHAVFVVILVVAGVAAALK